MSAPITGNTASGEDGDNDRGRALHFGDESGSDFIAFMPFRKWNLGNERDRDCCV